MWAPTYRYDYLCHHGILGMKWGDRNGPPYPLGAEDHSSSEKKAGWRASLTNEQKENLKTVAKITAGVVLGATVVGGTIYLAKTGKLDDVISTGKQLVGKMNTKQTLEAFGGSGNFELPVQNKTAKALFGEIKAKANYTIQDDINVVNSVNGQHNCGPVSISLLSRYNHNINMVAKNADDVLDWDGIKKIYPGMETHPAIGPDAPDIIKLKDVSNYIGGKLKEGQNGMIGLKAKNSAITESHFVTIFKENGTLVYRDAQFSLKGPQGQVIRGLEYTADGKVSIGGKRIADKKMIKRLMDKLDNDYNFDVTQFARLDNVNLTDNKDILLEHFKKA